MLNRFVDIKIISWYIRCMLETNFNFDDKVYIFKINF